MRLPQSNRRLLTQVNLTPLIDVVFNLVIFFLVISHFSQGQPAEGIDLPIASRGKPDDPPHRIVIRVMSDGGYRVAGQPVTTDEIQEMIQQSQVLAGEELWVRVQGDRQAPFSTIEPIMLACAKMGVTNFGFDVLQDSNAEGAAP